MPWAAASVVGGVSGVQVQCQPGLLPGYVGGCCLSRGGLEPEVLELDAGMSWGFSKGVLGVSALVEAG